MAIPKENYVDITSGEAVSTNVERRQLIARIFTKRTDVEFDESGVNEYNTADKVLSAFGADSDEYKFAVRYFGFVSKSITKATLISFAQWKANESVEEALSHRDSANDNYGSFAFATPLSVAEAKKAAAWNATKNYRYLYSVPTSKANAKAFMDALGGYSGVVVTYEKEREYSEFMPMVLFAATDYTRVNAAKTFMFQTLESSGAAVSVNTSEDADELDKILVNYFGSSQNGGKKFSFYQQGVNANGEETSVYCNEVWMKDAIVTELLNLFCNVEKIPSNRIGVTMVETSILSVVREAVNNGTIIVEKELTTTQKAKIDILAGTANAWKDVYADGYWLQATLKDGTGGKRIVDYILLYSKGDSVRKVVGSDILV